jgi:hypothetical protein
MCRGKCSPVDGGERSGVGQGPYNLNYIDVGGKVSQDGRLVAGTCADLIGNLCQYGDAESFQNRAAGLRFHGSGRSRDRGYRNVLVVRPLGDILLSKGPVDCYETVWARPCPWASPPSTWRTIGLCELVRVGAEGYHFMGGTTCGGRSLLRWLLLDQTGFYGRDLAVDELVCQEPFLVESFELSQVPPDR